MKKVILMVVLAVVALGLCPVLTLAQGAAPATTYDFGDGSSRTLTGKAWAALEKGDIEAVLAYTNKCIELYGEQAKKMQAGLTGYTTGSNDKIHANWALNDVATCLFIQGEAYRKAKMNDEAKEVFNKIVSDYSYGQCWDTKGWFWKPAEAAKEKLAMIASGSTLDFGNYTSETLTVKAWEALKNNDLDGVLAYTAKCLELYEPKAKEMQAALKALNEYPVEKDKIFANWALNDVGTNLFIKGEALKKAGKNQEAKEAYERVVNEFSFAQCWDPQGWFWKPLDAAQRQLAELKAAE